MSLASAALAMWNYISFGQKTTSPLLASLKKDKVYPPKKSPIAITLINSCFLFYHNLFFSFNKNTMDLYFFTTKNHEMFVLVFPVYKNTNLISVVAYRGLELLQA